MVRILPVMSAAVAMTAALTAFAQPVLLTEGEVEVEVEFDNGEFELLVKDELSSTTFQPDQAFLGATPPALRPRPPGSQFDFIGVAAGEPVYILPQVEEPGVIYLGISAEDIGSGVFQNNTVQLDLVGLRGPGEFSMWRVDGFGNFQVFFATAVSAPQTVPLSTIAHSHYNWSFTEEGIYEMDVQARGTLLGGDVVTSGVTTYTFVIPEPATAGLLALGGLAMLRRRR